MNCSKCGSSNCRSYATLYQAGTSTAPQASLDDTGRTRAELAARCKPPGNLLMTIGTVLAIVVGVLALFAGGFESRVRGITFPASLIYGIVAMVISAPLVVTIVMLLSRILGFSGRQNRQMAAWRNTFLCLDCSHVMHIAEKCPDLAMPAAAGI